MPPRNPQSSVHAAAAELALVTLYQDVQLHPRPRCRENATVYGDAFSDGLQYLHQLGWFRFFLFVEARCRSRGLTLSKFCTWRDYV